MGIVPAASGVQEDTGPGHVGLEEHRRTLDGPVDVALGGKVDHGVVTGQHLIDQIDISDVAVDEMMTWRSIEFIDRGLDPGVGEQVEVGHLGVAVGAEKMADEVGADEPGSSGDQETACHRVPSIRGRDRPRPAAARPVLGRQYRFRPPSSGQSIPTSGSSQARVRSCSGE